MEVKKRTLYILGAVGLLLSITSILVVSLRPKLELVKPDKTNKSETNESTT